MRDEQLKLGERHHAINGTINGLGEVRGGFTTRILTDPEVHVRTLAVIITENPFIIHRSIHVISGSPHQYLTVPIVRSGI